MVQTIFVTRTTNVSLWTDFGYALQYSLIFVGPLAAGAGAWVAARDRRLGLTELMRTSARTPLSRHGAAFLAAVTWLGAAFLMVTAGYGVVTARGATSGGPDFLVVATGLTAVVSFAALGYLAGTFFPFLITAPAAVVIVYVVQGVLGLYESGVARLVPVTDGAPSVVAGYDQGLALAQTAWFLSLVVAAGGLLALRSVRGRRALAAVAALATPILPLLAVQAQAQQKQRPDEGGSYACRGIPGPAVCLHPAFTAVLPQVAPLVRRVGKPLEGLPEGPRRYEQTFQQSQLTADGTVEFSLSRRDNTVDPADAAVTVARALTTAPCSTTELASSTEFPSSLRAQLVVAAWLVERADIAAPESVALPFDEQSVEHFAALQQRARDQWLTRNYHALRSCQIGIADLP